MAFRFLDQVPQFFVVINGTPKVLAGGTLTFTESGTTTPMDTYSDMGLTTPNTNPIVLNSNGMPATDIWMSGNYRVVLADSSGAVQWSRDNVQAGSILPDPAGQNGKTVQSDGTNYVLVQVQALPDPTGHAGQYVTTDGTTYSLSDVTMGDGSGGNLTDWVLVNVRDKVQNVTAASATTIDFADGAIVLFSHGADCTLTIAAVVGATLTIHRIKDATGTSRALTWPSNVLWPGGNAPTLTQTASSHDVFSLQCAQPNWIGSYVLNVS